VVRLRNESFPWVINSFEEGRGEGALMVLRYIKPKLIVSLLLCKIKGFLIF